MSEYKLELKGISKSFPGVKALDNVSARASSRYGSRPDGGEWCR